MKKFEQLTIEERILVSDKMTELTQIFGLHPFELVFYTPKENICFFLKGVKELYLSVMQFNQKEIETKIKDNDKILDL